MLRLLKCFVNHGDLTQSWRVGLAAGTAHRVVSRNFGPGESSAPQAAVKGATVGHCTTHGVAVRELEYQIKTKEHYIILYNTT